MSMGEVVIITCDQCKAETELKESDIQPDTDPGEWIVDVGADFCCLTCKEKYYTENNPN